MSGLKQEKRSVLGKSGLVLAILAILLLTSMATQAHATGTAPTIGVHVGEKLCYRVVSTLPPKFSSISVVTATDIFVATGFPYTAGDTIITCSVTSTFDNGTVTHFTGWLDMSVGGGSGLGGFVIFPANLKAGTFEWGGNTFEIQTKRMLGSVVDYTHITLTMGTITWKACFVWFQSTGVVIYMHYNFPPMFVGTITLLGHIQCRAEQHR